MATTQYTWNPLTDSVLEETDNLGNVNVTYTNEPRPFGPLLSENRGGQTNCYHFDAIGSTRLMTNSSQTVIDTNTFDAWGNSVASTGTTPTPYQWCGRFGYQYDSVLGSNYVRARTYQPAIGRWISVDPLSTWPWFERYFAYVLYVYAANTPTSLTDPRGAEAEGEEIDLPEPEPGPPSGESERKFPFGPFEVCISMSPENHPGLMVSAPANVAMAGIKKAGSMVSSGLAASKAGIGNLLGNVGGKLSDIGGGISNALGNMRNRLFPPPPPTPLPPTPPPLKETAEPLRP